MNYRKRSYKFILTASLLSLGLASLACGSNLQLPFNRIETGPAETSQINLPLPEGSAEEVELNLEFAGGELRLAPGAEGYLVEGTVSRRAERSVVALPEREPVPAIILTYLNRLSDLLFTFARLANQRAGVTDRTW